MVDIAYPGEAMAEPTYRSPETHGGGAGARSANTTTAVGLRNSWGGITLFRSGPSPRNARAVNPVQVGNERQVLDQRSSRLLSAQSDRPVPGWGRSHG
jgi:hypothetical protein